MKKELDLIFTIENTQLSHKDYQYIIEEYIPAIFKHLKAMELRGESASIKLGLVFIEEDKERLNTLVRRVFLTGNFGVIMQAMNVITCRKRYDSFFSELLIAASEMFDERKRLLKNEIAGSGLELPDSFISKHIIHIGGTNESLPNFDVLTFPSSHLNSKFDYFTIEDLKSYLTKEKVNLSYILTSNNSSVEQFFQTIHACCNSATYNFESDKFSISLCLNISSEHNNLQLSHSNETKNMRSKRGGTQIFDETQEKRRRTDVSSVNSGGLTPEIPQSSLTEKFKKIVWIGQIFLTINQKEIISTVTASIHAEKSEQLMQTAMWPNVIPLQPCKVNAREFFVTIQKNHTPIALLKHQTASGSSNLLSQRNFLEIHQMIMKTGLFAICPLSGNHGLVVFPLNQNLFVAAFLSQQIPPFITRLNS